MDTMFVYTFLQYISLEFSQIMSSVPYVSNFMVYGQEISWETMSLGLHFAQIEAIAQPAINVLKPFDVDSMHVRNGC